MLVKFRHYLLRAYYEKGPETVKQIRNSVRGQVSLSSDSAATYRRLGTGQLQVSQGSEAQLKALVSLETADHTGAPVLGEGWKFFAKRQYVTS